MTLLALFLSADFPDAHAASGTKRFDISAGLATETLRQFSAQTGDDARLLYSAESVDGVTTHAVSGEMRPSEALDRMFADTVLQVVEDRSTGALMITRAPQSLESASPSTSRAKPRNQMEEPNLPMKPNSTALKRNSPIALVMGWLSFMIAPAGMTLAQGAGETGVVRGVVVNEATGARLQGARVELERAGSSQVFTMSTEVDGSFRFAAVPAGTYELKASYTGLNEARVSASVSAGAVWEREIGLNAEIYKLGAYVVAGEREGSALAITQ